MDNIIEKAKKGLSEGFEKFLRKNYDGQTVEQQVIEFEEPESVPGPLQAQPTQPTSATKSHPLEPESIELPITEAKPPVEPMPFPPITWYILRYKYRKRGSKTAMVVIQHGDIKEEYEAIEWLKLKPFEPTLGGFIAAVVSAVKPETEFEARMLDTLEYS